VKWEIWAGWTFVVSRDSRRRPLSSAPAAAPPADHDHDQMLPKIGTAEPALAAGPVCHGCGAGWERRGQDRRHARTRKDPIDSHTKFSIAASELGATAAARLGADSEQFRSVPKTRRAPCGTLSCCKPSASRPRSVLAAAGSTQS